MNRVPEMPTVVAGPFGFANSSPTFQEVAVVERAVEHGGGGRDVPEPFRSVLVWRLEVTSYLARS